MKERKKFFKKFKKKKKNILATPGFEPTTFCGEDFYKTGTFMNVPRNFWQCELSAVSPDRAQSSVF